MARPCCRTKFRVRQAGARPYRIRRVRGCDVAIPASGDDRPYNNDRPCDGDLGASVATANRWIAEIASGCFPPRKSRYLRNIFLLGGHLRPPDSFARTGRVLMTALTTPRPERVRSRAKAILPRNSTTSSYRATKDMLIWQSSLLRADSLSFLSTPTAESPPGRRRILERPEIPSSKTWA